MNNSTSSNNGLTEQIQIPIPGKSDYLNLTRFKGQGEVVFMVHGIIENGKIFYSKSNKGLAPFLAKQGYDVYILDLRGKGLSRPLINKSSKHGQTEAIIQELPLAIEKIIELRGKAKQHWVAHSWGGVLLASLLARKPHYIPMVSSQVYFGSKRTVKVLSMYRIFYIDLMWRTICNILTTIFHYLPAEKFNIGSDNETKKFYKQSAKWVIGDWIDSDDHFNYKHEINSKFLPPTLFIAAKKDHALGHPDDVYRFLMECGKGIKRFQLLAKQSGNKFDYDHINMLTHNHAENDVYPEVVEWITRF